MLFQGKSVFFCTRKSLVDEWVGGCWIGVKTVLRIAYSTQKLHSSFLDPSPVGETVGLGEFSFVQQTRSQVETDETTL